MSMTTDSDSVVGRVPTLAECIEKDRVSSQAGVERAAKALDALDKYPGVVELIQYIVAGYGGRRF
jgi:hypothetical protein